MISEIDHIDNIKSRRRVALYASFVVLCLILIWLFLGKMTFQDPPFVDRQHDEEIELEVPQIIQTEAGATSGGSTAAGPKAPKEASAASASTNPAPTVLTNPTSTTKVNSGAQSNADKGDATQVNAKPTGKFTFGGNGSGGSGDGSGSGSGSGDMGGLGQGGSGGPVGFMSGTRKIIHKAPQFPYSDEPGKVVIMVYVDKNGAVLTSGKYAPHLVQSKSNIRDNQTVNKALKSAKKAVFSPISADRVEKYELVFDLVYQP